MELSFTEGESIHIYIREEDLTSSTPSNQRTNGPVNAHLKPEIYTNKLI